MGCRLYTVRHALHESTTRRALTDMIWFASQYSVRVGYRGSLSVQIMITVTTV
jgi:hypothetical protein